MGPADAAGPTFDDYVADTNAVIDDFDRAPVLVGHSLGGLLAQRLAEQGRARPIVLIASAPPGMLTPQPMALRRFFPKMPRILTGRPFVVGNDACVQCSPQRSAPEARPTIHAHLTPESGRVHRALVLGTIRVNAAQGHRAGLRARPCGDADDVCQSDRAASMTSAWGS
jgi:pimeloyl-ACP methyl ester carboxylesterase